MREFVTPVWKYTPEAIEIKSAINKIKNIAHEINTNLKILLEKSWAQPVATEFIFGQGIFRIERKIGPGWQSIF